MAHTNPWKAFERDNRRFDQITSTISRIIDDLGLFVALDHGIDGIVHLSDLDWELPGQTAIMKYSVGDAVTVTILSIDPVRERISLGIKQLRPNPKSGDEDDPPAPSPVKPKRPNPQKPLSHES